MPAWSLSELLPRRLAQFVEHFFLLWHATWFFIALFFMHQCCQHHNQTAQLGYFWLAKTAMRFGEKSAYTFPYGLWSGVAVWEVLAPWFWEIFDGNTVIQYLNLRFLEFKFTVSYFSWGCVSISLFLCMVPGASWRMVPWCHFNAARTISVSYTCFLL